MVKPRSSSRKLLVVAMLSAVAAGPAVADSPEQTEAYKLFDEGRDLLINQGDAKGACEKFEKAIALDPTAPGVMLNLGLCYEKLEKYATSLYWFRKAQFAASEAKPAPLTDYEDAAKQHTADLVEKVAIAKIDASKAPPGVRISVDGRPVLESDYGRLEVDNDSVIEARAPGKQPFRQPVEVTDRAAADIVIVMVDEVAAPIRDPGKGQRRLAYAVGAGGVVLWGVTLAYGLRVRDRYNNTTDGHYDGPDGFDNAKHDLRVFGTGLFTVGAAALGAAFVLYFTAPKAYRESREQAVAPILGRDHVGLGYATRF